MKKNTERTPALFHVWLAAAALVTVYFSLTENSAFLFGKTKTFALALALLLNVLMMILLLTGRYELLGFLSSGESDDCSPGDRKAFGIRLLAVSVLATALVLVYCLMGRYLLRWTTEIRNCIVLGSIFCAEAAGLKHVKLPR